MEARIQEPSFSRQTQELKNNAATKSSSQPQCGRYGLALASNEIFIEFAGRAKLYIRPAGAPAPVGYRLPFLRSNREVVGVHRDKKNAK